MTETSEPTKRSAADRARAIALWCRDIGLGGFGFTLVLVVALAGWSASFIGLHAFSVGHMSLSQHAGWLVPITFDGAPAGLSIVVMRAGIHGRSAPLWRLLIIGFTLLSSWINWQHITDPTGREVAALMPPSAVILFEGLMSEVRAAAHRRDGHAARPTIHPLRWLFDFTGTLDAVRQYVISLPLTAALVAPSAVAAQRPADPPQGAIDDATQTLPQRPAPAMEDALRATSKRPAKTPPGRAKADVRGAARIVIRALYDENQKRPVESDMVAALKKAKLPSSRQFANARRLEIEREEPHLAALGSDNVRTMTGT
ncbi:DUF2637 domain-containing protein [Streptacidiphilus sp. EB129]|uniref:DUF2637 domain-containing protein n=1 Tax=Streptacidiphilus sp. EB129 TaxID=3156262 RepID=UPI00351296BB